MNNKFCVNCGNSLKDNEKFCGKCGKGIVQNNSINNTANTNTPMPIILGIASLVLFFVGIIALFLSFIIYSSVDNSTFDVIFDLILLSPILGIIIMIIGRIMYSKSAFLKIVMWIIIALIVLPILLLVFLIMIVLALGFFMVFVLGVTA